MHINNQVFYAHELNFYTQCSAQYSVIIAVS